MIGLEFSLVFLGFCLLFDVWRDWRDSGAIRFQLVSGLSPLAHKNEHAFMRQPPIPKKGALCSFYGTVGRLKTGSAGRLALLGGRGADGDGTPSLPRGAGAWWVVRRQDGGFPCGRGAVVAREQQQLTATFTASQ